jgi:phosphate:Na+ symporter
MSANVAGKRLAAAHLLFNLVTALVALLMLEQFMLAVDSIAAAMNIAADDVTLKLAIFHSLFNLVGILIMLPFIDLLVRQIERLLKGKQVQIDKPKYLNDEAMKFPDTVVLAVHKEMVRLYRHASHIILKTIGLSSVRVFSDKDLDGLLHINKKLVAYDVDKAYKHHIKDIYSEVIAFISQASFTWEMKQSGKLYWLREANRHIVEAIKDSKQLQHNLLLMNASSNTSIQQEYYKIRYQIAELLRELDVFRLQVESDESGANILSFDIFKVKIKQQDEAMNQQIDKLIREHKITAAAGTSLINDSAYMYAIKRHLVDMAETIFVVQKHKLAAVEREVALDDNELADVLKEL